MKHSLKIGLAAGIMALCCSPFALAQGAGAFDGAYEDLDLDVEDQESSVRAAEEAAALARAAAEQAEQTFASAVANITAEERALIDASNTAVALAEQLFGEFDAATLAESEALAQRSQAQANFSSAQSSLAIASGEEAAASAAVTTAANNVAAAQAALNATLANTNASANDIVAAREALQTAEQDFAVAQTALSIAESATANATATVSAAATAVLEANSALAARSAATAAAQEAFSGALAEAGDLFGQAQTALAGNDALTAALALADPNYQPGQEANSLNALSFAAASAVSERDFLTASADFEVGALNGLIRQGNILTAAATSGQTNIELASGALTGDPAAVHSNYETEVLGALVDHEVRISSNTSNIAVNASNIAVNASNIAAETEARIAADNDLLLRITDETQARMAADTALNSRVDILNDRVGVNEARISELSDKVKSSTAVAIALGGTGFLPDKTFNFSTSVATYEGAQAMSATLGARLSNNMALTAGVAGGLNKEGGVGARVGLIFGW